MATAQGKSYVVYFRRRAPIHVFVNDINAICDTLITLTATITGNPSGRNFLWEFVSGSPISWLTPQNQLSVQYQRVGTTYQDTLFYFWVDKGNPRYEEMYEVWVYATPTEHYMVPVSEGVANPTTTTISIGYFVEPHSNLVREDAATIYANKQNLWTTTNNGSYDLNNQFDPGFTQRHASLYIIPRASISTATNVPVYAAGKSTSYYLVWTPPLNQTIQPDPLPEGLRVKEYILQEQNTPVSPVWYTVGTFADPVLYPATTGRSYRVIIHYETEYEGLVTFSSEWEYVTSVPIYVDPSTRNYGKPNVFGVSNQQILGNARDAAPITSYNVLVRSLTTYDWVTFPELEQDQQQVGTNMPSFYTTTITNYNVIVRSLTTYDWVTFPELEQDQQQVGAIMLRARSTQITNYVLVGGGTIGG